MSDLELVPNNKYPEPDWSEHSLPVMTKALPDGEMTLLAGPTPLKCLGCLGNYIQAQKDRNEGVLVNGETPPLPIIRDAVTYAPNWQTKDIGGGIIYACVMAPSCWYCLVPEEKTPAERATRSGLALPQPGGWPNPPRN